ncbi:MAG: SLBB domain-containing protein [Planctomycetota bacterium]
MQYTPTTLPAELLAEPRFSVTHLQLAGLTPAGSGSDILGEDDLLSVHLTSGLNDEKAKPYLLRVSPAGSVDVPHVGEVRVAGVEPTEAGLRIAAAGRERGVYRRPQVTVKVAEKATYRVVVMGAVARPGVHELPRVGADVVSALAAAGGLNEDADPEVDILRRPELGLGLADAQARSGEGVQLAAFRPPDASASSRVQKIDLLDANQLSPEQRRLGDRDVVLVHPQEEEVIHVSGLVQRPAQFELLPGKEIRLLDALAMAGGRTSPLADRVLVIRRLENAEQPVAIEVSVSRAKASGADNLLLAPGDLVSVESSVLTTVADVAKSFFRVSLGLSSRFGAF